MLHAQSGRQPGPALHPGRLVCSTWTEWRTLDQLLIEQYQENSTTWAYTRALMAFRRGGDSARGAEALERSAKKSEQARPGLSWLAAKPLPARAMPALFTVRAIEDDAIHLRWLIIWAAWKVGPLERSPGSAPSSKILGRNSPKVAQFSVGPSPAVRGTRLRRLAERTRFAWQADFPPVQSVASRLPASESGPGWFSSPAGPGISSWLTR